MIKVTVPATSANVCIGFDCLGMAVNMEAVFTFEKSDTLLITGCPEEFANINNLVVQGFRRICQHLKKDFPTFHLHIDSPIPLTRGLGSSSACVIAGILGADAWFESRLDKKELLAIAIDMEGHPDNVAPAIYGQTCVGFMDDGQPHLMNIPCPDWKGLAIIPPYPIHTDQARKILPTTLPYRDVTKQVGYALTFVQALQAGDELVLSKACHDFLHEPYRKKLIPEYDSIKNFCLDKGFPMWISGSGSTMLAISLNEKKIKDLESWMNKTYPYIECKRISISKEGARVEYE